MPAEYLHWPRSLRAVIAINILFAGQLSAMPPAFRRHEVNAQSEFPSCAVMDVNTDGKLDIVSGGWWYEAPNWKKHFVREVEHIRGRYDDYSNLPLDVNGDGRLDLISANYRSQKIYWIENPGPAAGPWITHLVAQPGASETARLADIDGDGRLDLLPNGRDFIAWWELLPGMEGGQVRWGRHDLPTELNGHGVGTGDINGDGRTDVVGPRGWAQGPADARRGRWLWQGEFQLHRDASIPILVADVDGDRDSDIVYARGHGCGLYWLEQHGSPRRWELHVIDSEWSQSHSIEMADLDNDGTSELIAGKRYLGHDGRDIGEWDPLWLAAYSLDPKQRSWRRRVISFGGKAALGLDPKLADLDADGDLDLVTADRSGLFWFENLLNSHEPAPHSGLDRTSAPTYQNHARLLMVHNADKQPPEQPIDDAAAWALRRQHILAGMQQAMGELPDPARRVPLDMQVLEEVSLPKYVRKKINFAAEPGDRVPALLLIPKDHSGTLPAMLCLHQTTKIGKNEPAGLGGLPNLHYAHELAERGWICLVPDYPSFGDYPFDFQAAREHYASGSMKAIWNNHRAVDLLETLPQVDRDKIGVIGHSLGGHNALFTAAFDLRLKAVVTSCGFTAFHHYFGGKLAGWTSDRYMPRIRDRYHNNPEEVPFDFHGVLAAIAPRAIFVNAPLGDSNFEVAGVRKVEAGVSQVFALLAAKEKLTFVYPEAGHDFPPAIREHAYDWLKRILK